MAIGGVGSLTLPNYPTFHLIAIPDEVSLVRIVDGQPRQEQVRPARAWRGLIRPFEDDESAKQVTRVLAANRPLDVHGGYLLNPPESKWLRVDEREKYLIGMDEVFDVLVLEFSHSPDPWVFSISPAISDQHYPWHPHLRRDRELKIDGNTFHGLCIYSSAEFSLDAGLGTPSQFLNQVSIFLGKHLVWLKTRVLLNRKDGTILHHVADSDLFASMPSISATQMFPPLQTLWDGYWPGRSALAGINHLLLNPSGPCWCGDGKLYKDCHRPWEVRRYGLSV